MTFVFEKKKKFVSFVKKQLKNFKVRVVWDADLIDFSKKKFGSIPIAEKSARIGTPHGSRSSKRRTNRVVCSLFRGILSFPRVARPLERQTERDNNPTDADKLITKLGGYDEKKRQEEIRTRFVWCMPCWSLLVPCSTLGNRWCRSRRVA